MLGPSLGPPVGGFVLSTKEVSFPPMLAGEGSSLGPPDWFSVLGCRHGLLVTIRQDKGVTFEQKQ